jgi:uncharacterized membrane protein YfcA
LHFVPVVVLADFFLTGQQISSIRAKVEWARVAPLAGGALFGVPLGVFAMAHLGIDAGRAIISIFVLVMCGFLLRGFKFKARVGPLIHSLVGIFSGLANGAAVGGLPVAVFFASQTISASVFRASMIVYFTLLGIWTLPSMVFAGVIKVETFWATLLLLPFMMLGVWLGGRQFIYAEPANFRRFAIYLLGFLSVLGLLKPVLQ